jgi:hypothetical protein
MEVVPYCIEGHSIQRLLAINQFRIHVLKQLQYFTHRVHHRPDDGDCNVRITATLKQIHQIA